MTTIFKLRRGSTAEWVSEDPILHSGEPGLDLDALLFKVGDGITRWVDLPYYGEVGAQGPQGPTGATGAQGPSGTPDVWVPSDYGLLGWSYPPEVVQNNAVVSNGVVTLIKIKLSTAQTITNVIAHVTTAGSALTSNQNFAALYNSSGNRLGVTADQSSAWASAGTKIMTLTTPVSVSAGTYYVALLANASTPPAFGCTTGGSSTMIANLGGTGASARFGSVLSAQTSMPSSFTPSAVSGSVAAFWAGLS